MKSLTLFLLFIIYVVTRPSSGHYREDNLVNPMLICIFNTHFDPKVTGRLVTKLGP